MAGYQHFGGPSCLQLQGEVNGTGRGGIDIGRVYNRDKVCVVYQIRPLQVGRGWVRVQFSLIGTDLDGTIYKGQLVVGKEVRWYTGLGHHKGLDSSSSLFLPVEASSSTPPSSFPTLVSLSFPASYWSAQTPHPLTLPAYIYAPFPAPFKSP